MRRPGCVTALAVAVVGVAALAAYRQQDYRPRFARAAGELVAVRDSTGIAVLPDGSTVTEVTLVSDTGFRTRARVRSPGLRDGVRRPAIIILGGYKLDRTVIDVPDTTGGVILASAGYPYDVRHRPTGIAWLWGAFTVREAMLDTPPSILLLAQYLYTRGDVDPERVTILGASLGAPFALAAAATDRRIRGLVLLDGGGDIARMMTPVLEGHVPDPLVPVVARAVAVLLAPLEPTRYADALAPRPLLMLNASGDEQIPRASSLALYEAARQPKRIVWRETHHIALSERDVVESLMDETLVWMREQGLR